MSKAECREFLIKAVNLAMYNDGYSGGCVRLVDITKHDNQKEYIPNTELKYK